MLNENFKETDICEICKNNLINSNNSPDIIKMNCLFCQDQYVPLIYCPNGHYICDNCHSKDIKVNIETFCLNTSIKDPFEMVNQLMMHPKFKMSGPEHYILSAAAILTTLKNNQYKNQNDLLVGNKDIRNGIKRASSVPGGWCGFYGTCGAAVGAGIALSIFTESTPSKKSSRTISNEVTSRTLGKIADNLEHCCKRSLYYAILTAIEIISGNFNCNLNYSLDCCNFSLLNQKCEKENSPFNSK